jgi:arylsulfatase
VAHSVSPLSYFKASQGEGGIRAPLIIKLPGIVSNSNSSNNNNNNSSANNQTSQTNNNILRAFIHVTDITPTILEYAGVVVQQQAAGTTTYKGMQVHPIMGKSIKPLLEDKVEKVHANDEAIAQEMFNNTAVFMGDWKAEKNQPPISDGKWYLFNITADVGENTDLGSKYPDIIQKLISDYNKFAKDVGVVVPSGNAEAFEKIGEASD